MMSSMLSLFSFEAWEKLDLEVLDFWLFTELSILKWFLTWLFKNVRTPVQSWSSPNSYAYAPWLTSGFLRAPNVFF